jgi:hypothetical protein
MGAQKKSIEQGIQTRNKIRKVLIELGRPVHPSEIARLINKSRANVIEHILGRAKSSTAGMKDVVKVLVPNGTTIGRPRTFYTIKSELKNE